MVSLRGATAARECTINAMEFDICNSSSSSNKSTHVAGGYNTVESTTRGTEPSRLDTLRKITRYLKL